jgi:spore coat protein U-like protein
LYQGSAPPDVTATASLTFRCTSSTTYTITDNNGLYYDGTNQRMRHATVTTAFIPYTYCYTTGTAPNPCTTDTSSVSGIGGTTPITLNISATVQGTSYATAQTGSYSDTVTMTISP